MTTRKVINIAATKKKDNMALYDPNNVTNNFFAASTGTHAYLFCPTARSQNTGLSEEQDRRRTTVYMKGYGEKLELGPNNGATWKWRRIVFETKGIQDSTTYQFTSNGYRRLFREQTSAALLSTAATVLEGTVGPDHSTVFTAKPDRSRVKVHSDVTRVMRSGNDFAHLHNYKVYYPFDRNLIYDDDEQGGSETTSPFASTGNHGMGDVYIWDIFTDVGAPNVSTDSLFVRCDGTIYWHEK